MSGRTAYRIASRIAWASCALVVVLGACVLALQTLNDSATVRDVIAAGGTVTSAGVGAVVASRRPRNPVGWFFLASSTSLALAEFTGEYALYGLRTEPGSLPLAWAMAWPQTWLWVPGVALSLIFLPLYFPNGRLLSRRWRWVVRVAAVFCAYSAVVAAVLLDEADSEAGIPNPLLIPVPPPLGRVLEGLLQVSLISVCLVAAASLVIRFRLSRGEERQQMKWLAYVAALMPFLIVLAIWFPAADYVAGVAFAAVPVTVGVAVLKYRLYDVDLIINRTLVYAVLTAALVLVYLGSVVMLRGLVFGFTGRSSQLVVVASTLLVAAMFNPLRRRIQGFIDRRFYRHKYDAAKTLESFSSKLRDETNLDDLSDDLVAVARDTMQPEHVSLWLREMGERR